MAKFFVVYAVVAASVAVAAPAGATEVLAGSFAGTSIGTQIFQPPFGNFDGTPVTGNFRIDLTGCVDYASAGYPAPNCGGGSGPDQSPTTFLTIIDALGQATFHNPGYLATVVNSATSQTLNIDFAFMDPYSHTSFSLVGPANAFIHQADFSRVFHGPVDVGASSIEYQLGRSYRGQVALTSLGFTDVPEPSSLVALATMIGIGAAGVRRLRKAG